MSNVEHAMSIYSLITVVNITLYFSNFTNVKCCLLNWSVMLVVVLLL